MPEIIRIVIIGESGYGPVDEAFRDKVTVTENSISYEYLPYQESEINCTRKWTYKTTSPIFKKLFADLTVAVIEVLDREEEPFVTDLGVTSFVVTYSDKSRRHRDFILPGDDFKDCFAVIKKMVPGCEYVPAVLLTSEDYND